MNSESSRRPRIRFQTGQRWASSDKLLPVPGSARFDSNDVRGGPPRGPEPPLIPTVFSWNVDFEAYLSACPPNATTRGTFFQHVCERVREGLGEAPSALYEGVPRTL